jgi:hypothetical protein
VRRAIAVVAMLTLVPAWGAGLQQLSNRDAVSGLKDALTQGAAAAVGQLGVKDGFLGNEKVRIPLPDPIKRIEGGARLLGLQSQIDELETSMNRAAEQAVPQAKPLFVRAIKNMSVQDAKGILTGGDTSATDYFRKSTSADLTTRFLPIVTQVTRRVGLTQKYDQLVERAAQLGLVDPKQTRIEDYVTRKALDGLFLTLAEEEKKIRQDPAAAATAVARKVFDLLRH